MSTRARVPAALYGGPLVLGTAAVAGLLMVWAAAAPRPPEQLPGPPPPGTELTVRPPDEGILNFLPQVLEPDGGYRARGIDDRLAAILAWTLVVVVLAVAGLLVALMVRALVRVWRARNRPPAEDARATDVVPAAVLADQSQRLEALGSGTPREGIVAAWARLEASIALAGVPLTRSRTSTEVVLATLRSHDISADTLEDLAALFREARYSPHVLTEADRQRAEAAHRRVDAELEQRLGLSDSALGSGV